MIKMIKRIRQNLMLRWMVFSILLATIPLTIAGFNIIQIYQRDLKKSVIGLEEMKADVVVEKTEAFFKKIESNLRLLANDDHVREGGSSEHLKNLLERHLYQSDYLSELTFLNEKGKEKIKVSKYKVVDSSDLISQSKSEMFGAASKGKTYYGKFYLTPDFVPTMVVAVPVEEYKAAPTGVLSAKIHLRYLWNLIPQAKVGNRGFTYVVDKEGDLVAHPDTRRVLLGLNIRHLPIVNQAVIGKEGSLEFEDAQGEKYLVVYKPIKPLGWGVVVQVPVEEAYAPLRQVAHHAVKWILLVLTLSVILSLFLTRRLTLPIKRLAAQMGEVAKGNLDISIRPSREDELGRLTESFNQMIQNLKLSQGALKEAEKKYRMLFENSKDMVYIISLDGKFVDVNRAGIEMLGYDSKEDLYQTAARDIYLNFEDREKLWGEMSREGYIKDFEVKFKKKDGTPIDVLITANARRNDSGEIVGYEGFIKDISVRKIMEDELVRRTEELEILYEMSVLINQTLDLDKVLPIALEKALGLTGFEMGSVHLLKEDGETLEMAFDQGQPESLSKSGEVLKVGEGVAGRVIQSKLPMIVSIGEYPTPRIIPWLREEGVQTLVGIPLLTKEKAIGAITLLTRSQVVLTQREINLLGSIGNLVGLGLENAGLFSNVARAKSEWETTFNAVTDLITIRDRDYRIIRANKAAFRRFGLEPEQIIGKKCFEVLHHQEMPCEGCYVTETLSTRKMASGERESEYLKGFFQYFTFPVYDEAGEVSAVVDLAREITEQKQREKEKEVVNNFNRILASSLDVRQVMKALHSELRKVLSSERMTITLLEEGGSTFRYFAEERDYEVDESTKGLIYPREGTAFGKAVSTGVPVIVEDVAKGRSWINQKLLREGIRSSLVFPLEYKGKVIGTVNFSSKKIDHFSERQFDLLRQISAGLTISIQNSLLLDEIKESEEKYRTVVEGAHDGVLVVRDDYRVKYANERLAEILGYHKEELIGTDFRNYLDGESKQFVADRYTRRQRGEEVPPRYEFSVVRKDGEIRNVEISSNIVKDSKGNVNTIAFIKDITERKKMEEQLLQAEKLRALGEMASGVAHDFNNALAAILGNTQLLLYTAKDEALRESLQTIEKVTKDSAQTVRRLQDFTRKRTYQDLFTLDINAIVKDAVEITKPKWKDEGQAKGIQIDMALDLEAVSPVDGMAFELREVVTNLIFNAIEAMPEGGCIGIRTFQKKEKVYLQILDSGIGMTEEVKKKIFEPFFTTKPFSNTGLGLSMSYGIIKRFGGEIEVESKVGHGTTFTLSLPVGSGGQEEVVLPSTKGRGIKARILIIDDEESVRAVLSRILTQVNHRVDVAENGEEGVRLFREREFDIVLTDLAMPGLSGWEVCSAIKKMSPLTPVGMITGWKVELDHLKIEETGLDFVISKPFDFSHIVRMVDEAIESRGKQSLT